MTVLLDKNCWAIHFGILKTRLDILSAITVLSATMASAQGTFQNLDFESANIPSSTAIGDFLPASEAIPDWTAYFTSATTTVPGTQVVYDGISGGGGEISIVDSKALPGFTPVEGDYAVILFGGPLISPVLYSASISQTGTIPTGTESLFMDAKSFGGSPVVAFDGQTVSMVPIKSFPNYTEYGGDISSFAGSTGTLSFTAPAPTFTSPTEFFLDDISFSTTPTITPEPDALTLMGIGGALFAAYRRFAPKRG